MVDDNKKSETEETEVSSEEETATSEEKKLNLVDLDALLKPISKDKPTGDDYSFSDEFDTIKEARRFDDPKLSQGEWETELKVADWPKAKKLCIDILTKKSKDLQVAGWLTEALGMQHGFPGLIEGMVTTGQMLEKFWDDIYPPIEEGDLDERIAKIEWIITMLEEVAAVIPIGKGEKQEVGLREWREAQYIKIQAAKDSNYLSQALEEGKIDVEAFTRAIEHTSKDVYAQTVEKVHRLKEEVNMFGEIIDRLFEKQSPGIRDLSKVTDELIEVVDRFAKTKLSKPKEEASEEDKAPEVEEVAPETEEGVAVEQGEERPMPLPATGTVDRNQILSNLRDAAEFFKSTEPHSPVGYLIERAIKWADMGLQDWLEEVVKDPRSLSFIKETLGFSVGAVSSVSSRGGSRDSTEEPSSYEEEEGPPSPYEEEEGGEPSRDTSYEDDIDLF